MKWKTKDGRELDIKEMTTGHLINAMNLVGRKLLQMLAMPRINTAWQQRVAGSRLPEMCEELRSRGVSPEDMFRFVPSLNVDQTAREHLLVFADRFEEIGSEYLAAHLRYLATVAEQLDRVGTVLGMVRDEEE